MRNYSSYKDDYDLAPWAALGSDHKAGVDTSARLIEMLTAERRRTRPKFLAKRLNRVGIPAPHGGDWTWSDVYEAILREAAKHATPYSQPRGPCGYFTPRAWR